MSPHGHCQKGWLGRCIALKAGMCMLVFEMVFVCERSGGILGREEGEQVHGYLFVCESHGWGMAGQMV